MGSNPVSFVLGLLMWLVLNKLYLYLKNTIRKKKQINVLSFVILNWTLNTLKISKLDSKDSDNNILYQNFEKFFFKNNVVLFIIDILFVYFLSLLNSFNKKSKSVSFLNKHLTTQLDNNRFYYFNNNFSLLNNKQSFFYGLKSVWLHLGNWLIPVIVSSLFIYYSFFLRSLPFSKIFFGYLLLGNMFYLLLSGFVFFIKKYQYRLYTSVIQRFWRRTLIIFWMIEGSLFCVFVYLIFNASQEPVYMYDNLQVYKTHFYSWRFFLIKIISSSLLIVLTYMLLLSIKWNTFNKSNNLSLFITVLLLYIVWLEFYQIFHLMNCYGTSNWVYDFSEHLWNLELEFKRTRIVNHYVTIGLVAKFWHVVFAAVFWIFFLLRGLESSRFRYPLLSANLQNFLIVYIMSWLYMYPWFKYVLRKILDIPYFWFFINNRKLGVFLFFNDIKLYYYGFLDFFYNYSFSFSFKKTSFYYWHESSLQIKNTQFRKHNIRDLYIRNIYTV